MTRICYPSDTLKAHSSQGHVAQRMCRLPHHCLACPCAWCAAQVSHPICHCMNTICHTRPLAAYQRAAPYPEVAGSLCTSTTAGQVSWGQPCCVHQDHSSAVCGQDLDVTPAHTDFLSALEVSGYNRLPARDAAVGGQEIPAACVEPPQGRVTDCWGWGRPASKKGHAGPPCPSFQRGTG